MSKNFVESTFGLNKGSEPAVTNFYNRLFESYGNGLQSDLAAIFKSKENAKMFLETVNAIVSENAFSGTGLQNAIMTEDAAGKAVAMSNIVSELLQESTQDGITALRPISLTSFGFQIRSYVKAQMHRAIKTLQADKPAFKITERKSQG